MKTNGALFTSGQPTTTKNQHDSTKMKSNGSLFTSGYYMLLATLMLLAVRQSHSFAPQKQQVSRSRPTSTVPPPRPFAVKQQLAQQHHQNSIAKRRGRRARVISRSNTRLYFFGRDNSDDDKKDAKEVKDDANNESEEKSSSFFGSLFNRGEDNKPKEIVSAAGVKEDEKSTSPAPTTSTATAVQDPPSSKSSSKPALTPAEQAAKLRSDAGRMRLEAERMDAELTLRKIERLEKELTAAKSASNNESKHDSKPKKDVEQLQREINALLSKVQGGGGGSSRTTAATSTNGASSERNGDTTTVEAAKPTSAETTTGSEGEAASQSSTVDQNQDGYKPIWPDFVKPFDQKEYDQIYDKIKDLPQFLLGPMAFGLGLQPTMVNPETGKMTIVNATEVAISIDKLKRYDHSYSSKPPPQFSSAQISEMERRIRTFEQENKDKQENSWFGGGSNLFVAGNDSDLLSVTLEELLQDDDPRFQELRQQDPRRFAQLALEFEYYTLTGDETTTDEDFDALIAMAEEQPFLKGLINGAGIVNGTLPRAIDSVVHTLYPKCTTKKDYDEPVQMPTEAQVNQLIADVLPKAGFQASSKPEEVAGGFIIRGSTKLESGDEFIDKLDKVLERSSLKDKMTVLYQADFSALGEDEDDFNIFDADSPILYVVGPEICREPRRVQLAIVSGLGLATSWYLSIFPFLLNPTLAARVDEQLALADASMTPDLAFLTDLSLPLFAAFVGIQLVHELAHLVVAGANGIKTSVPVFVPSIITGITSTVTTFKEPVKNKAAMFDFAVSGPLAGIVASTIALVVGAQLTAATDPASFPALPLEILRQSTLGGGIIEAILGNDVLSIPEGARGSALVNGMTVPLHPVALAGYFGLVVNALALLPIGTTDGGRVALSLFGRLGKGAVGSIFFFLLLIVGLTGSDLFLFYFSFCIAFQAGNEVPARNEVDKLDIPRVFLATGTYVLAALTLIPF